MTTICSYVSISDCDIVSAAILRNEKLLWFLHPPSLPTMLISCHCQHMQKLYHTQSFNHGKKSNGLARGPSDLHISVVGIQQKLFPFPNAIHKGVDIQISIPAISSTTTLVSEITIIRVGLPVKEACFMWSNI